MLPGGLVGVLPERRLDFVEAGVVAGVLAHGPGRQLGLRRQLGASRGRAAGVAAHGAVRPRDLAAEGAQADAHAGRKRNTAEGERGRSVHNYLSKNRTLPTKVRLVMFFAWWGAAVIRLRCFISFSPLLSRFL